VEVSAAVVTTQPMQPPALINVERKTTTNKPKEELLLTKNVSKYLDKD
jgi:hypothetical protein